MTQQDIEIKQRTLPDRISVFRNLTVGEITNDVNMELYKELLDIHYAEFIEFCEDVKLNHSDKTTFSCVIENGVIRFFIK